MLLAVLLERRCSSPAAGRAATDDHDDRTAASTAAPATTAAAATTTASTAAQPAEGTFPVTVTDDNGNSVTINAKPMRIVSTAPANTETLFALGVGDRVVGVTSLDDYPPEVAGIAKIGDFQPNTEAIMALSPDLVVGYSGNEEALAPVAGGGRAGAHPQSRRLWSRSTPTSPRWERPPAPPARRPNWSSRIKAQIKEVADAAAGHRRIAQGLLRPRQHPVDVRPGLVRRRAAQAGQRHQRGLRARAPTAPPPRPTTSSLPSNSWRPTRT